MFIFLFLSIAFAGGKDKGIIRGKIRDKESGETLIGVTVMIDGTAKGTVTDFDGTYSIEGLEPGKYTLVASYVSYSKKRITNVEVKPGDVTVINFNLELAKHEIDEVVISAKKISNSENAMLSMQRKADGVQDGISAIEMKRYGTSNAAETMTKVVGVSVVDGKDVYVRGLGDRYTSVQMDGQNLPSTDPYKNSAELDLIPSNLLENIITSKTFTPDQPGSFTGGNVNIKTKSFPERFTLNASVGLGFNDQSTFNDNFLTFEGGKWDWLGYDDGTHDIPEPLQDTAITKMLIDSYYRNARKQENQDLAETLDNASKSMDTQMTPTKMTCPVNQKVSFSIGNQVRLFNRPLGLLAAFSYKKSFQSYADETKSSHFLAQADAPELATYFHLNDTKSTENPQLSGMVNIAYKLTSNHAIDFNISYNHDTELASEVLHGSYPGIISTSDLIYETRTLRFTERELAVYKMKGKHVFPQMNNMKIEWSGSRINSTMSEPDLRMFSNTRNKEGTSYYISSSEYLEPLHYFRDLEDQQWQGKVDVTIPIFQSANKSNKIKFGALYSEKKRDFAEAAFQMQKKVGIGIDYAGDAQDFFGSHNVGIIETNPDNPSKYYIFGQKVMDRTITDNSYDGTTKITAYYGMATINIGDDLKVVAGARYEDTDMDVISDRVYLVSDEEQHKYRGDIKKGDFLPAINMTYKINDRMNVRASYTNTLARPNMREKAPFASFEFIGGVIMNGNPDLKSTFIYNYDARWEWFPTPGELIAFSAYYKKFENPIIQQFILESANPQIKFENVPEALVYGMEIEVRKQLSQNLPVLKDIKVGGNFSLIKSKVDIKEEEYEYISSRNPEFDEPYRPFQGQSPFLLNANISYDNNKNGIDAALSYNIFGRRLAATSTDGIPDIYEKTKGMLNLNLKKSFAKNFSVGLKVKNILNSPVEKFMDYKNTDYYYLKYNIGRTYSISISYSIN